MTTFCPVCGKEYKEPSFKTNAFGQEMRVPRICLSCQAKNSQLAAQVIEAGKVKKIPPGESGLDREAPHQFVQKYSRRK